ncbi:MAG: hypothetical protein EU549_03815, partial [Promethearchaeota archaeon]
EHGIQRISNGDWNDMVVLGFVPRKKHKSVKKQGESVLNSAMACYVMNIYSELLFLTGKNEEAKSIKLKVKEQQKAIRSIWHDKWFKRAWLSEKLGWVGEDRLWLEPQPWTIIGKAASKEQQKILLDAIDNYCRKPSKIGAILMSSPIEDKTSVTESKGTGTNAGVWPSINGTLIWALSLINGEMAWDEWKKNTLAYHAETYPKIWYGIWSGPDTYNSIFSKHPGQTIFSDPNDDKDNGLLSLKINWTDFPVMNMHPHAWPLYTISKLIGIQFNYNTLKIHPVLPKKEYKFITPLIKLEKSNTGYSGEYKPKVFNRKEFTLEIKLDEEEINRSDFLIINGNKQDINIENDKIIWTGMVESKKSLIWELKIKNTNKRSDKQK